MRIILPILILGSLFVPGAVAADEAKAPTDLHAQVDKVFARWDSTISPGCALSVIKDGQIVYKRGYGMADLDHDIPITTETVFHVASISKQFTAAAILLLAQDGKLSLDDEVHKYVTELPDFGQRITIRHVIHHTSGLRDQWELLSLAGWRYSLDLITDDDVLEVVSRQKDLNFKPGEKYVYCNTGYTLLGQIVKRVSGKSLREFTTERIFQPLGMKSTHFRDDHAEIVKHIAYGYVDGDGGSYRLSVTNFDTVGATSLLTTVEDLAQWDDNFYHPRVGGPELIAQQLQRGKLNSGKEIDYAFGLSLHTYRGLPTVEHGGADAGYRAHLMRFPEQHFTVACLCNKGEIAPQDLAHKVADIYLAGQFKEPPAPTAVPDAKPVVVSEQRLAKYAGLYWNKENAESMRIVVKDGKLFLARSADEVLELKALSEDQFRLVAFPVEFRFTEGAAGARPKLSVGPPSDANLFEPVDQFQPPASRLSDYAGTYVSDEIEPVYRIAVENGGLVLKVTKSKPQKLEPTIQERFHGLNGEISFQKDASGKVTGFLLDTGRIRNFRFHKTG